MRLAVLQFEKTRLLVIWIAVALMMGIGIYGARHATGKSEGSPIPPKPSSALANVPNQSSPFAQTVVLGKAPDPVLSEPSRPSFECAATLSPIEAKICTEPALGRLDADLARLYKLALDASSNRRAFEAKQMQWIRDERNACADVACLQRVYELRMFALKGSQ